jgi:hypothetical protein
MKVDQEIKHSYTDHVNKRHEKIFFYSDFMWKNKFANQWKDKSTRNADEKQLHYLTPEWMKVDGLIIHKYTI